MNLHYTLYVLFVALLGDMFLGDINYTFIVIDTNMIEDGKDHT